MTSTVINRLQSIRYLSVLSSTFILGAAASISNAQQCNPVELTKLLEVGATEGANFGRSVDIDGDLAVVGAPQSDANGIFFGAAHLYKLNNAGIWVFLTTLEPNDGAVGDRFGNAVSISGDTVIIGSPFSDNGTSAIGTDAGAVYVFTPDVNGEWVEEAKLIADDWASHNIFGLDVDLCDDTLIIGASTEDAFNSQPASAYVFIRSNGVWTQQQKLVQPIPLLGDFFGYAVGIEGDLAVVGAREISTIGETPVGVGSVFVFARQPNNTWTHQAHLQANNGAMGDGFGDDVSLSGDTLAIGAPLYEGPGEDSGAAYLFNTNDGGMTWTQNTRIVPIDGSNVDLFGNTIAIDGDTVIVGSTLNDDFGNDSGSTYVYAIEGGEWALQSNLLATDGEEGDHFSNSLAISGEYAIIGALQNDDNGLNSGSAYMFDLNCNTSCPADLNSDGDLNFFDVSAFLTAFTNQDPIADFATDGLFNFFDVSAFLAAFAAGCP